MARRRTVLARLAGALSAPTNTRISVVTAIPAFGCVGDDGAIPACALAFDAITLAAAKLVRIVGLSAELVKMADAGLAGLLR